MRASPSEASRPTLPPPAVAVVIPCYAQADLLPVAVASVVQQTFTDWELVVVDDGSPDDTAAVTERLVARLPGRRIRLVRQANAGLAEARNAGIRASTAPLVLPLDADDALDPTFLEKTVAALAAEPGASIATTDLVTFGAVQRIERVTSPLLPEHVCRGNVQSYCSLYRRAIWEAVGGYAANMTLGYEDWDFWVGCAERGFRTVHVAEPLFFYRVREGTMLSRARAHHRQLHARIVLNHPALFDPATVADAERILAATPLPSHCSAASPPPHPHLLPRSAGERELRPSISAGPVVSIVMPCFRQAEFLPQAIASVERQTFRDWEIVVVNDGSPDDTSAVTRDLARKLPGRRIRLLEQANAGLAAARNAGIAASEGRYVLPLDADDLLDPSFLERTVAALEADPGAALAFTDVFTFGAHQELRPMGPWDPWILRRRNVACASSLFRREAWAAAGGYNTNMVLGYEDWDLWIGFAERGFRAVHVAEALFFYRLKPASMVTQAIRHHAQLAAQVALNHPAFFDPGERAAAAALLAERPLPPHAAQVPPPRPAEVRP